MRPQSGWGRGEVRRRTGGPPSSRASFAGAKSDARFGHDDIAVWHDTTSRPPLRHLITTPPSYYPATMVSQSPSHIPCSPACRLSHTQGHTFHGWTHRTHAPMLKGQDLALLNHHEHLYTLHLRASTYVRTPRAHHGCQCERTLGETQNAIFCSPHARHTVTHHACVRTHK